MLDHPLKNEVVAKQNQAKLLRKKGDAMRKAGREEIAQQAYIAGVETLENVLNELRPKIEHLDTVSESRFNEYTLLAKELVEIFGTLGGMFQRLGSVKKALDSYSKGANLEKKFRLPSTYNRLNEIKYLLLTGQNKLSELEPQIQELATHIETTLREDQILSDSGWPWADLGDCMALLGRQEKASQAYTTFISKAEIKSPERTLDILKEILFKLKEFMDPDVPRLEVAINILQGRLEAQ